MKERCRAIKNLDRYYQKYQDRLLADGVDEDTADTRILEAGWVEEEYDAAQYFIPELISHRFVEELKRLEHDSEISDPALLVTTGSFDPIHDGHVAMMAAAGKAVEENGYTVVSGVMSSGHDDYVREQKTSHGANGFERCNISEEFLDNHVLNKEKWLFHDNWEALIAPSAVNFTTVIEWVKTLMRYYAPTVYQRTTLFYVFGSDNASFSHALIGFDEVKPVIVERKGYVLPHDVQEHFDNGLALFAENDNDLSSTIIRQQKLNARPYVIRQDLDYATVGLKNILGAEEYDSRLADFRDNLVTLFDTHIENKSVLTINMDDQLQKTQQLLVDNFDTETVFLSADKYLEADNVVSIDCSRVFNVGSEQKYAHSVLVDDKEQADKKTEYVFVDDDIASGFTLGQLRERYHIVDTVSMLKIMVPYGVYDVVDERDFLLGAANGGLMCETDDGNIRFPYMFPFVNLNTRAKVSTDEVKVVSARLWNMNREFFAGTGIRVKDVENNGFFGVLGTSQEAEIEDFCQQMVSFLGEDKV